jgi:subtilase family serine protease
VASGKAHVARPVDPALPIQITVVLVARRDELQAFVREVTNPSSPLFREYLSFDETKARFAPSDAELAKVEAWAEGAGLRVIERFRTNHGVRLESSVATLEQALSLQLNEYENEGHHFFANDRAPELPTAIAPMISEIFGLESQRRVRHAGSTHPLPDIPAPVVHPPLTGTALNIPASSSAAPSSPGVRRPEITGSQKSPAVEPPDLWSSQGYNFAPLRGLSDCCGGGGSSAQSKATGIAIVAGLNPNISDLTTFFTSYGIGANPGTAITLNVYGARTPAWRRA